jgi:hypothetical protein
MKMLEDRSVVPVCEAYFRMPPQDSKPSILKVSSAAYFMKISGSLKSPSRSWLLRLLTLEKIPASIFPLRRIVVKVSDQNGRRRIGLDLFQVITLSSQAFHPGEATFPVEGSEGSCFMMEMRRGRHKGLRTG